MSIINIVSFGFISKDKLVNRKSIHGEFYLGRNVGGLMIRLSF